jgi:hypothetical protein
MSDNWMIILPADPLLIPSPGRQEAARALLASLRPDAEPELRVSASPEFFDCGGNFEGIFCPFCQADIVEWWQEQMDKCWHGDRRNLAVETACCSRPTSLNDVDFVPPQGLACFAIELMNGGADLEPSEREQVEAALGAPVRIVWRHI